MCVSGDVRALTNLHATLFAEPSDCTAQCEMTLTVTTEADFVQANGAPRLAIYVALNGTAVEVSG